MAFVSRSFTVSSRRSSGFTLIEVIFVLILLGILSAVAVSRGNFATDQWVNPDIFASHLRYAQSRAMAMEQPWGLEAQDGTYSLFKIIEGAKVMVDLPGGSTSAQKIPNGIWWFDGMGRPYSGQYTESSKPADQDILIVVAKKNIIITANTGYVP